MPAEKNVLSSFIFEKTMPAEKNVVSSFIFEKNYASRKECSMQFYLLEKKTEAKKSFFLPYKNICYV